jgi:primosomal protein N'
MTNHTFADVAPAVPLSATGRQAYTYRLPHHGRTAVHPFSSVTVPFGRAVVPGVVLKLHSNKHPGQSKEVKSIAPITLTAHQVALARWLARVAQGSLGYTLRLFQPPARRVPASRPTVFRPGKVSRLAGPTATALIERSDPQRLVRIARQVKREVAAGRQVLIIVPERWMAAPMARAVQTTVASSLCVCVHAGLSASALNTAWHGVRGGQIGVVIGTQKALYLPYYNLGLIVIDEEHYSSHKLWDAYPRLHNRYAAQQLAALHRARLVYATSFPSLWLRHALEQRHVSAAAGHPLRSHPALISFSADDKFNRYPLPQDLLAKLKSWHKRDEHILLFYNRRARGFIEEILVKHGLASSRRVSVATSAVFTARAGQKFDRIVWLFPERDLAYPDFRSGEHALYTLSRLQQLLAGSRRVIHLVTRREDSVARMLLLPPDEAFAHLMRERIKWSYPPHVDLVRLTVSARTEKAAWKKGGDLRRHIDKRLTSLAPAERERIKLRGPFRSLAENEKDTAVHLLISGSLERLIELYHGLPLNAADLAPARIL